VFVQSQNMPLEPFTRMIFAIFMSVPQAGHERTQALPFFCDAIFAGRFPAMFSLLVRAPAGVLFRFYRHQP